MICTVCGEWGDLRHFVVIDGEVVCKPTYDYFCGVQDTVPFWFGGTTNEEGEVYGG